jgi:membrane protein implicated in regulation of membrane protease activity
MEIYQITIIIAIVLAILELLTFTFILLGMAIGLLAVAMIQYATGILSWNRDIFIFCISAVVVSILFRKLYKKNTDSLELKEDDVNQY